MTIESQHQVGLEAADNRDIELEALPCPFCGSGEIQLDPSGDGSWTLDCYACGAGSGTNEKEFVLRAWNKRTSLEEVLKDRGLDAGKVESEIRAIIAAAQAQRGEQPEWTAEIQEIKDVFDKWGDEPITDEKIVAIETGLRIVLNVALAAERHNTEAVRKFWSDTYDTVKATLETERQRREQAEETIKVLSVGSSKETYAQLLSAQAAIESLKYTLTPQAFHGLKTKAGDLSLLHQHDAELKAMIAEVEQHNILGTISPEALANHDAEARTAYIAKLESILKDRSKGEVDTWGFVAMFLEMMKEANT